MWIVNQLGTATNGTDTEILVDKLNSLEAVGHIAENEQ